MLRNARNEAFDADDVVFSWQRVNTPGSLVKGNLSDLKDVRKVDAFTVDVETHTPLPILPNAIVQLLVAGAMFVQLALEGGCAHGEGGSGMFQIGCQMGVLE